MRKGHVICLSEDISLQINSKLSEFDMYIQQRINIKKKIVLINYNHKKKIPIAYLIFAFELVLQERESSQFPGELEGSQYGILRRQCYQGR